MSHRIRNTEPRDLLPLWKIADAQNRRDGTSYPVPAVFEMDEKRPGFGHLLPSVPLALTVERDNRVRGVTLFLRTIEIMSFTAGHSDMLFSAAHIPMAVDFLRRRGYSDAHTFIPQTRLSPQHVTLLESYRMIRLDPRLATFYKDFRET